MKQKVWSVSVLGNKPTHQRKNIDFYTTDTKAELVFEITDKEMNPTSATISIYNKDDKSLVSEDHPVKNKKVTFPMYTTDRNVIEHNGSWVAQVVFEQNGGKYTSRKVRFTVGGNVLDDTIPSLDIKENMKNLVYQLEQAVADAKAKIDEVDTKLKKTEATRVANETQRLLDEAKRKANELAREESENLRSAEESSRADEESKRVAEESKRILSESVREQSEATRVEQETAREFVEKVRDTSETERKESEALRRAKETERDTSESDRLRNDILRENAESARVNQESIRESNEAARITSDAARQNLFNLVKSKLEGGELDGSGLEFAWRGTELGVRLEGEPDYEYVDLKGETGSLDNLCATNIEEALGFMPISIQDIPDTSWSSIEGKPTEFKPEFHTHEIADVNGLRAELDSVPELTKENVGLGNVDNVKQASKVDFDNLLENFTDFKGNIGKFKATENGTLEYHDGKEWIEVRGGTEFKVGNTSGFTAEAKAGLKIEIKFGDPEDFIIIDENGDEIKLAELGGTQLRAKKDSHPVDENDGILLVDSKVKNQYKDTPFIHDGLTDGEEWFYMAMPYTKAGVFTIDPANRGSAVATNKLNQPTPAAPTISDLEFDRVTVTGGDVVSLDKTNWFDSPHTFTNLTEETDYIAYAKRKETDEFMESDISPGNAFKTPAEQRIYGVRVDESNSNPETRVTYIGDSVGFTPMSGNNGNFNWGSWEQAFKDFEIRPVILKNKAVNYYLDPSDFAKRVDGSIANLTGADGDVMIELGKTIWHKRTDIGTTYTVEISDKEFPGAVKSAFEIEDGYNLVPYYPLLLTQILYIIFFKSTDSQTALGRGRVDGAAGYASTGGTDKKGMFYGSASDEQMKFLGIEDYWGNKLWWIDGLVTDASRNILIGKKGFNDSGSGYTSYPSGTSLDIGGYMDRTQGGNDKCFIIKSGGGSATTYYADYALLYSSRVAVFGGGRLNGSSAGAFFLRLADSASDADGNFGGRLFCASNGKIYIGAYLGTTQSGKLRSVSGTNEPTGNKTIGVFRTEAKANN